MTKDIFLQMFALEAANSPQLLASYKHFVEVLRNQEGVEDQRTAFIELVLKDDPISGDSIAQDHQKLMVGWIYDYITESPS